jgi:ParB/RepB/Spo0J family partition protein
MSEYQLLSVDCLRPNPLNARMEIGEGLVDELAASIREQGILQPLLVCPNGQAGAYYIVAGHRRWLAAQKAGLPAVPCVVRRMSEREQQEAIIVENLQRQDLSPVEEARAYQSLKEMGMTNADIGRRVGCVPSRIGRRLTLLKLDPQVQDMVHRAELAAEIAPSLSKVADVPTQRRLALLAAKRGLTVAQMEDLIKRNQGQLTEEKPKALASTPARAGRPAATTIDSWSRRQAVEALRARPNLAVTTKRLVELFDDTCGVCGECGMASMETVCEACPLPQLIARLAE